VEQLEVVPEVVDVVKVVVRTVYQQRTSALPPLTTMMESLSGKGASLTPFLMHLHYTRANQWNISKHLQWFGRLN